MWVQVKRVLKPRGVFVTTASQPFTSMLVMSNFKWFKYSWYFRKQRAANFSAVQWQPLKVIEEILIFSNGATTFTNGAGGNITFNPQKVKRRKSYKRDFRKNKVKSETTFLRNQNAGMVEYTHASPECIIYYDELSAGDIKCHPTQKPVALYEYLIRTYTNPGETVLDFTMGSGTTGVASIRTGRNFIGCELYPLPDKPIHERDNPDYFAIAQRRCAEASLQPALFQIDAPPAERQAGLL